LTLTRTLAAQRHWPAIAFALASLVLHSPAAFGEVTAAPYVSRGFVEFPQEVELSAMSSVALDAKDNLYVLHRGSPPIVQFDPQGKFLRAFGEGLFKVAHGLRVDREGNVWTTDNGNHVLRKFSPEGRLLMTLGQEGKGLAGKAGFKSPDDLVFDSRGHIFVADAGNGRIVELAPDGTYLGEFGKKGKAAGQFAAAHAISIDGKDRLYVADRGNKRVQVFDRTGQHLASYADFAQPFGVLAVGDELIVSDGDAHKLYLLDAEGKAVATWGDAKSLQLPHLMAVDSKGLLYVTEVNGKRVQKFLRR
jgi:sugar lactone lactonase YvrE